MPSPAQTHLDRALADARDWPRAADDPELIDARRNMNAATLEAHIEATLTKAPPLTDAQRRRLADLLAPAVGKAAAAARIDGTDAA